MDLCNLSLKPNPVKRAYPHRSYHWLNDYMQLIEFKSTFLRKADQATTFQYLVSLKGIFQTCMSKFKNNWLGRKFLSLKNHPSFRSKLHFRLQRSRMDKDTFHIRMPKWIRHQTGAWPTFRLVVNLGDFHFHISWKLHAGQVCTDLNNTSSSKLLSSPQQRIIYYKRQSDQTKTL